MTRRFLRRNKARCSIGSQHIEDCYDAFHVRGYVCNECPIMRVACPVEAEVTQERRKRVETAGPQTHGVLE